ncbi:hypothetical protein CVD28_00590 [Bacillus sp. M6-12]|uniref:hypothetical protein n=1 Tax=Bacillus sp. M6-12 TaxID=2054166 RepID=UPI000C76C38F|nr:hypothetical protein [Bacillus sp. M6-12]PLS18932.1 hypothetical protein CVD28_00590 [Bacillus sp. M6-12]
MPTYITIEFIRDFVKSNIVNKNGQTKIVWKTIHSVGKRMRLKIGNEKEYIKGGYAKYIH